MRKKLGILFLALILCACSANIQVKKKMFTIELGKDIYANPSLYLKNDSHTSNLKMVAKSVGVDKKDNRFMTKGMDYLVVGEYDFAIENGNKEYPFVIKVKDTTPPVCSSNVTQINVSQNQTIDWNSYFHATDLSGVIFTSNVDTSQTGNQEVEVKISDRFGNAVTKTVTVVVS